MDELLITKYDGSLGEARSLAVMVPCEELSRTRRSTWSNQTRAYRPKMKSLAMSASWD